MRFVGMAFLIDRAARCSPRGDASAMATPPLARSAALGARATMLTACALSLGRSAARRFPTTQTAFILPYYSLCRVPYIAASWQRIYINAAAMGRHIIAATLAAIIA